MSERWYGITKNSQYISINYSTISTLWKLDFVLIINSQKTPYTSLWGKPWGVSSEFFKGKIPWDIESVMFTSFKLKWWYNLTKAYAWKGEQETRLGLSAPGHKDAFLPVYGCTWSCHDDSNMGHRGPKGNHSTNHTLFCTKNQENNASYKQNIVSVHEIMLTWQQLFLDTSMLCCMLS